MTSRTAARVDLLKFQTSPFFTQWNIKFHAKTLQDYVQDDIAIGDAKISLGWKGFKVDNRAAPVISGGRTAGDLSVEDWFQPHIGVNYDFGGGLEAFAGFTSVTRAFGSSTTSGPFSSTQTGFNAIQPLLKPESSDTYEAGIGYGGGGFHLVLAAYHVDFRNRLLTIPTSVGIVGAAIALQNVGSVRAQGLEATAEYKTGPWTLFGSCSYNDNTYRNKVVLTASGTTTIIRTAGKTVVDSPEHLAHLELAHDDDTRFLRVSTNYMSHRYFTYANDKSVDGRAVVDLAMGYRFDLGMRKPLEVQFNVTNLFDLNYVSTIGSNGFGNSGDNQTLLAGAPRQLFVSVRMGL